MNTEQKPEAIRLADNITASGHTEREAFEAWWRENVSQGLAEIDHDYRYWALWQARAAFSVDHIADASKMVAPVVLPEPVARRYKDKITGLHHYGERPTFQEEYQNTEPLYAEHQVRELLAGVSAPAAQAIHLLAADHSGMKVDYRGLFSQVQRVIKRSDPGYAEMLRQLEGHLQELGQRWYAGDTNVVDEILQLYCIERGLRKTVRQDAAAKIGAAAQKGE